MGLFARKEQAARIDKRKTPHAFDAPATPPASGPAICRACDRGPNDPLHVAPRVEPK
jgi:hypothetical protein